MWPGSAAPKRLKIKDHIEGWLVGFADLLLCQFEALRKAKAKSMILQTPLTMHAARTALNQDPELRQWVETWLKNSERTSNSAMSDAEFEKHWLYVRPERMHEGAIEAVTAYIQRNEDA